MQEVNPESSDEKYLNAPKDILKNIRKQQKIILEASHLIKELKSELCGPDHWDCIMNAIIVDDKKIDNEQ